MRLWAAALLLLSAVMASQVCVALHQRCCRVVSHHQNGPSLRLHALPGCCGHAHDVQQPHVSHACADHGAQQRHVAMACR